MQKVVEKFKNISAIPRCSFQAEQMRTYIRDFAHRLDFVVHEDDFGNLLCQKGNPKICLQAHYDMVCIGDTSKIELVIEGNILKAKNSTLGADNGMGMAIMFECMEEFLDLECLFTADEEVGLIGASNFSMPLASQRLLNIDGEVEGEIYIGCAGGVDVVSRLKLEFLPLANDEKIYEVSATGFLGGHSGVDIDKHIPSAIKALAHELGEHSLKLISLHGGERRNAIAQNAHAIVASHEEIILHDKRLHVRLLEKKYDTYIAQSDTIIKGLCAFAQGIRAWDRELDIPSVSINLGTIIQNENFMEIDCAARAMDDESLDILAKETSSFFELMGFITMRESFHSAWKPEIGEFAENVRNIMQKEYSNNVEYKAIHAGLECGVLIASQSQKIEAVSVGPTILYPHSLREECDLDSVERMAIIVKEIVKG